MVHIISSYAILIGYLILILVLAYFAKYVLHASDEIARKITHIMIAGIWMLLWVLFWGEIAYVITAAVAVVVGVVGMKTNAFAITRRNNSKEDDSSVFYYTFGELILASLAYVYPPALPACTCGIMSVAFGDGTAALAGKKWGKYTPKICGNKSLAGSLSCFCFAMLAMIVFCKIMGFDLTIWKCAILALVATCVELVANKFDNLLISLSVALVGLLIHVAA